MKAAICYEFGQPLRVEDVEIDAPCKGEVKVRLAATGICHSDVHLIRGEWGGDLPVVAGHEAAGVVEEVGDDVMLTQPGDRVVVSLIRSCGRCFYCATGSPQQCEGTFALQTESRLRTKRGVPLRQGLMTAAFAEYTIVDQSQVVPVPDDMPLDRAALLACGVITGVGAVTNIARVTPGSSVVVIGLGGVGLNAVQGAVLAGAFPIIALDVLDTKLVAARTFGASHAVNAGRADALSVVKDLTGGRRADYVFVTVGSPAAVAQGLTLVRREGTVAIVGIPDRGAGVPLGIAELVLTGKRVIGCLMGATRLRVDVPRLVALYQQGRLKLDELITARYPLEQINEAIAAMERGEALRNVVVFAPDA
jgi:NDMA-dependent alcohol dehydrogenase